jgi:hypothetical protein
MVNKFVLGFIGTISIFMVSCVSSGPYKISQELALENIKGKTVFVEIGQAKKSPAYIPLIDAGIYNVALAAASKELLPLEKEKLNVILDSISEYYSNTYNVEVVKSDFSYPDTEIEINYFSKYTDSVQKQVIAVCNENDAEFAFTLVSQIATSNVNTLGINGNNYAKFELCIFDKNGVLIGTGTCNSQIKNLRAADVNGFVNLYNTIIVPAQQLINALVNNKVIGV